MWFNSNHCATFIDYNDHKMNTRSKEDAKGLEEILANNSGGPFDAL